MHNKNKPREGENYPVFYILSSFKTTLTERYYQYKMVSIDGDENSSAKRQIGIVLFLLRLEVINYS